MYPPSRGHFYGLYAAPLYKLVLESTFPVVRRAGSTVRDPWCLYAVLVFKVFFSIFFCQNNLAIEQPIFGYCQDPT